MALPEYEQARRRLRQQIGKSKEELDSAMARRFSSMGAARSGQEVGAASNLGQRAFEQAEQGYGQIRGAESQEMRRQEELQKQTDFERAQAQKQREYAAGELASKREFTGGEEAARRKFQENVFAKELEVNKDQFRRNIDFEKDKFNQGIALEKDVTEFNKKVAQYELAVDAAERAGGGSGSDGAVTNALAKILGINNKTAGKLGRYLVNWPGQLSADLGKASGVDFLEGVGQLYQGGVNAIYEPLSSGLNKITGGIFG